MKEPGPKPDIRPIKALVAVVVVFGVFATFYSVKWVVQTLTYSPRTQASADAAGPCVPSAPPDAAELEVIAESTFERLDEVGTLCDPKWRGLVDGLVFFDGDRQLASSGRARDVALWSVAGGTSTSLPGTIESHGLALSPDGLVLVAGGERGALHGYDVSTRQRLFEVPRASRSVIRGLAFTPDGASFFVSDLDGVVSRWSRTGTPLGAITFESGAWSLAVSHDGKTLAAGAGTSAWLVDLDGGNRRELPGQQQSTWSVAFSADDALLAAGSNGPAVRLFDVQTAKLAAEPAKAAGRSTIRDAVFSPSGELVAFGTWTSALVLTTTQGAARVKALDGHQGRIQKVTFSKSGKLVATGGDGGVIRLWGVRRR
ncbi:MAG: WD40 repeat domain-containing protein [Myxococcaceae bacterium]|nr:WD40 repeat domain-containing protein [Myxococcaceae bacterium]